MKISTILLALGLQFIVTPAFSISYLGFATPTTMTYHFTSVDLKDADGNSSALVTEPFTASFSRSDADFAGVTLKDVAIPIGRYLGITICQTSAVDILFDGVKFDGPNGTKFNYGDTLYTVKTDNSADTLSTSAGSGAVTTAIDNSAGCPTSYFPVPLCVTDDAQATCAAGDVVYTSTGQVDNAKGGTTANTANTTLKIFLMVDLYDAVAVDSGTGQIAAAPNVMATVGKPGAAIHLSKSSAAGTANVSMVFSDKDNMLFTGITMYPGGSPNAGHIPEICSGQSNAYITDAPSGAPVTSGIVFFNIYDSTANSGKGKSQTPTVSSCMSAAACNSNGVNVLENFIQSVGNQATGICKADSAATPPYLGYTYTGGDGYTGVNPAANLPIVRIIDPGNLFNICTSGFVNGHTGTCSSVNAGTDGYY